jgi:hypothetical protein
MKKKAAKKPSLLALAPETIRHLDSARLTMVAGGAVKTQSHAEGICDSSKPPG